MENYPLTKFASAAIFSLIATSIQAGEQYNVRMNPGAVGYDIVAPTTPGHFGAVNLIHTKQDRLTGEDGKSLSTSQRLGPNTVPIAVGFKQTQTNLLLRYTYISEAQWLGAKVGATVLLPYATKKRDLTLTPNYAASTPGIPPAAGQNTLNANLKAQATAGSGSGDGLGDLEISPIMVWESETSKISFNPSIILPTGKYDKNDGSGNIGQGNFYTFRPSIGYGRVFNDNWAGGVRLTYGTNTKNKDTDYKSGDFLALDGIVYTSVGNANLGFNLYHMQQLSADKAPAGVVPIGKLNLTGVGLSAAFRTPIGNAEIKYNQDIKSKNTREGKQLILRLARAF
jgi:hypothetical protein